MNMGLGRFLSDEVDNFIASSSQPFPVYRSQMAFMIYIFLENDSEVQPGGGCFPHHDANPQSWLPLLPSTPPRGCKTIRTCFRADFGPLNGAGPRTWQLSTHPDGPRTPLRVRTRVVF
uniref:Uncharacterized protein n=1 Tax=Compsopogon caeruleus TaxID=31354 RepID=A0A7S1TC04_9RHOD